MSNRYLPPESRCPTVIFMNGRDWQCARIDGHAPDGFGPDTPWAVVGRGCRTFTQPDPGALDAWWEMHHIANPATRSDASEGETSPDASGACHGFHQDTLWPERVLEDA